VDDTHGSLVEGATRCVALVVVLLHRKTQDGKHHLGT
jgi:hypothetical protein